MRHLPLLVRVALDCSVRGGVFLRFRERKTRYSFAECALAFLLLAILPAAGASAADGSSSERATAGNTSAIAPLEFRRVFTPAGQWKDWPRDGIRYVPMKSEEFERLVNSAQGAVQDAPPVSAAVTSAEYRATLDSGGVLRGEATLGIAHGQEHSVMLPLDPCGLAIAQAEWAGAKPQAAQLGLGIDGKMAVLVTHGGELRFRWTLRGEQEPGGGRVFTLDLPACPTSRLLLDLPTKLQPVVADGVAIKEDSDDSKRERWRIEMGGHHRVVLRIVTGGESKPRQQLTLVRSVFAYDLSLHGLDLTAELRLDVHDEALREVVVAMDQGLELVKAQYGDVATPWSILTPPEKGHGARVLLQLPEAAQGAGRVLRLGAVAPLELGQRWRLPGIRTEGMFWQEGSATIGVRAPLNLEQLAPIHGRQSKTGTLSGPRPGQSAEIQYFAEDAGVEVVLAELEAQLHVDSGTSVELSRGEITGRVVAELAVTDGELFQLEADVGRQWLIDSVEAEPDGVLHDDWTVKKEDDGSEKLVVHLDKALSPTRGVRLIVTGRRLHSPSSQPLDTDDLMLLRFADAAGHRSLMAVRAVEPYRLRLEGAEHLKRIEPENLTEAQRRLFPTTPRELVFEKDTGAASLEISLVSPKPSYSATIRAEATAFASRSGENTSRWLRESYWVRCVPDVTRVDRVLIHFCSPRTTPPRWNLGAGTEGQFEARLLSAAEQASAAMDTRGETWELVFRQPKAAPFEIHASRSLPWDGRQEPISLVCVPEAAQQQGSLVIRSVAATAIRVQSDRLDPLPLEDAPSDQISTARARFRYSPMSDAVRADQPAVTVELEKTALPAAWIWDCQLESRYQVEGGARHSIAYCIESNGKTQLELKLPASVSLEKIAGISIDGSPASWHSVGEASEQRLVVELPEERRFPVVCLHYRTDDPPLRTQQIIEPQMPTADVPVLTQHWTVWLPPGYGASRRSIWGIAGQESVSSWPQRVFGPLGQTALVSPFNPLAKDSWTQLVNRGAKSQSIRQVAEKFVTRLSDIEEKLRQANTPAGGDAPAAKAVPWGDLLGKVIEGTGQMLLFDSPALSRIRLDARTPVVAVRSDNSFDRGIALLEQAKLALLVSPKGLLLTSAADARAYHPNLVPLENGTLWQVQEGPLADRLQQAGKTRGDPVFRSIDRWRQQSAGEMIPWTVPSTGDQPLDTLGWNVYRTILSPGTPTRLAVTCQDTIRSLQWGVFLVVFAILWWVASERPAVSIAVLSVSAAAALVLAGPYAAVASGAVLGAIMALVLYLVHRWRKRTEPAESEPSPSASADGVQAGVALLVVLSLAAMAPHARADDSPTQAAKAPRVVYDVLIPVDEQQKPSKENYLVPEALYQQLQRRASGLTEEPQGWLLCGAAYRGTLARQAAPEQLVVNELKAVFDLEVFNPSTRIRIPLGREGVNLLPEGATLDGRVIEPEWLEADGALVFDVREAGPYRLELSLRPAVKSFRTSHGIDLHIPRLPSSRLELSLPSDAPAVEVPSAIGSVSIQQVPARLVAELGATDRLTVRWPDVADRASAGPAMDVEQMYWLKVHPGSVVLSTKLKVKVIEGVVRQLRLAVDPRLRLLPFRDTESAVSQVQTTAGEPQTIQFDMARPISDQAVIEADFLLTGTSGIGKLRLPQVQVVDARVTKRWLAVSVDRALVFEQQAADQLEPVAVPVFEAAWGKAEGPPALAYNLPSSQPAWSLATRPDEPRITVDQMTVLSFAPGIAKVQFDAQVSTSGYGFQYHLSAPKQLRVESVEVQDSVKRAARWSRDAEGGITVFLNEPATGKQRLTVHGTMITPVRGPAVLPILWVDGTSMHSCEIQVFREPSVLVTLADIKGLNEVELPIVADDKAQLGRLVKAFTVPDRRRPVGATVNLTPNQPEMVADQVTYLHGDGETWEVEVEFHVKVGRGVADEFRIQTPALWQGPLRIDLPADYRLIDSGGKDRREVVIQPRVAVDHECRFRVSGALVLQPGERLSVPSIRLLDADRGKCLLVLPKQLDAQPINWQTRGLKVVEAPAGLASPPIAPESPVVYELQSNSFQAVLNLVDHTNRTPNVLLADLSMAWQDDGTYQGTALFDLEPAGLLQCPLHLPSQAHLISVRVDGATVVPQPESEGEWQVPLQSGVIPQRLEVLFTGRLPDAVSTGIVALEAPRLGRLPVWRTLWSVSGPPEYRVQLPSGVEPADTLQMNLVRLQGIAWAVDLIQGLSMRPDELEKTDQWQGIWCRRWEDCRQQLRQYSRGQMLWGQGAQAGDIDAMDRKFKEIRSRLDRGGAFPSQPVESAAVDVLQLGPPETTSPRVAVRCISSSGPAVLSLSVRSTRAEPWLFRLFGLLACVAVLPLAAMGSVRRLAYRSFCRWPAVVGVAAGIAWWLWLVPSVLGWLVIVGVLIVALMPRRRESQGNSSVVMVHVTKR